MLKKMVAGMMLASALPTMATAGSLSYDFGFMGSSVADSGSGTITLSDTLNSKGGYDITGISGTFGGNAITGLLFNPNQPDFAEFVTADPFAANITYDNVFFLPPAGSFFDGFGIAFNVAGSVYNIFDGVAGGENPPPGTPYALVVDGFEPTFGTFTATQTAVPEASTWAMLIVGFGMMGGSIRYSRKTRQISA